MLHVLTKDGQKMFSGTRREVKLFLRKNNVKNYVLKEHFTEKVTVSPNPLSEPSFNKIFD